MNTQDIKNFVTVKAVVSIATLVATLVSGWLFIDNRYAHAEAVQRTTAQIALDAQESLIDFRLETTNRSIRSIKRRRDREGTLDTEDSDMLQELREDRKYLKSRKSLIHDKSSEFGRLLK